MTILARMPNTSSSLGGRRNTPPPSQKSPSAARSVSLDLRKLKAHTAAFVLGASLLVGTSPASALDIEIATKTWNCLIGGCRNELARCLGDASCAANIVCVEACGPDDLKCQVRCGDVFQNKVVEEFNSCLLTKRKCIPQKADDGEFKVPPDCALVNSFNTEDFTGTWYITSGLNAVFDIYDCQVHEFSSSSPHSLTGKLTWRVRMPDGSFITRDAVQNFVQSSRHPGIIENHNNEYLNYKDDWYIVSARFRKQPDDFMFVYYKGTNDAWDGYGGAVIYTRSPRLPESIIPQLREAAARVGLDFDKFTTTDNSCKPQQPLSFFAKIFDIEKALATK